MNKQIDELGRLVIPKEIRNSLNITKDTIINIKVENEYIILIPINEIIYCRSCKSLLKENYKYCYQCGVLISDTSDELIY